MLMRYAPFTFLALSLVVLQACGGEAVDETPAPVESTGPSTPNPPPPEPMVPNPPGPGPGDMGTPPGPPGPGGAVLTIKVKEHTDRLRTLANEAAALTKQLDKEADDVSKQAGELRPGNTASVRRMEGQARQLAEKAAQLEAKLNQVQDVVNLVEKETDKLRNRAEK